MRKWLTAAAAAAIALTLFAGPAIARESIRDHNANSATAYFQILPDGAAKRLTQAPNTATVCYVARQSSVRRDWYASYWVDFYVALWQDLCTDSFYAAATALNGNGGVLVAIPSVRLYRAGGSVPVVDAYCTSGCAATSNAHRADASTAHHCDDGQGTWGFIGWGWYRANPTNQGWRDEASLYSATNYYISNCPAR